MPSREGLPCSLMTTWPQTGEFLRGSQTPENEHVARFDRLHNRQKWPKTGILRGENDDFGEQIWRKNCRPDGKTRSKTAKFGHARSRLWIRSHAGSVTFPCGERYVPMLGASAKVVTKLAKAGYWRVQSGCWGFSSPFLPSSGVLAASLFRLAL